MSFNNNHAKISKKRRMEITASRFDPTARHRAATDPAAAYTPAINRRLASSLKWTPLHEAVYADDYAEVKRLLQCGEERDVTVNALDFYKWTPLHYALNAKLSSIVMLLVEHGADAGVKNCDGKDAFAIAKETKQTEFLAMVIEKERDHQQQQQLQQRNAELEVELEEQREQLLATQNKLKLPKMRAAQQSSPADDQRWLLPVNPDHVLQSLTGVLNILQNLMLQVEATADQSHNAARAMSSADDSTQDASAAGDDVEPRREWNVKAGLSERNKWLIQNVSREVLFGALDQYHLYNIPMTSEPALGDGGMVEDHQATGQAGLYWD